MKTETTREIAERLAQNFNYAFRGSYVPSAYRDATIAIEVALNAERERAFDQGYVCATANIVRLHGADTIARDVLNQNKPKDWSVVDEADKAVLELARGSKD